MNSAIRDHDASVLMEEAPADRKYNLFSMLGDSDRARSRRRDATFPPTTSRMIGCRIGKPGSRLEMFRSQVRPLGDIYKTLKWPMGCAD